MREEVTDGQRRRTESKMIDFDGKEVYINTRSYLFGAEDGTPIEIAIGSHRYDFACQLPTRLPASFEASKGNIRYSIKAVLDVPWGPNKEFDLGFTVVRNDDLNLQPQLKIPCQSEEIKRFCCFCFNTNPLIMTVTVPFTGYTPGETIDVEIAYENESSVEISSTKVSFIRYIRYTR